MKTMVYLVGHRLNVVGFLLLDLFDLGSFPLQVICRCRIRRWCCWHLFSKVAMSIGWFAYFCDQMFSWWTFVNNFQSDLMMLFKVVNIPHESRSWFTIKAIFTSSRMSMPSSQVGRKLEHLPLLATHAYWIMHLMYLT